MTTTPDSSGPALSRISHVALTVTGSGLAFTDPDGIALEFFAAPGR